MNNIEALEERYACLATLEEAAADGVSFASGAPGTEELRDTKDIILKATTELLASDPDINGIFKYGAEQGCEVFRKDLAKFLSQQYGDDISSSNLMVTAGATQGLHFVFSILTESSAPVLVEDPTYFIALKVFQKDLNRTVVPVSSDDTGVDISALDEKLQSLKSASGSSPGTDRFWAVIYLVTVFGNPTGITYSQAKCQQLVQLARKHQVLIVVDDVYNLLWFQSSQPPAAPPRLMAFDRPSDPDFGGGHVVSVGTFSKYLSPALRLGWLEASDELMTRLSGSGLSSSGGSFNHYMSKLISWALKFGLITQHLASVRAEYARRMEKMCDMLDKHLPKGFTYTRPQGGFYLWLKFPNNVDTFEFARFSAERYGVIFIPGIFASPTDGCYNCVRLSISAINEAKIETGIKELCMAYKDYCTM